MYVTRAGQAPNTDGGSDAMHRRIIALIVVAVVSCFVGWTIGTSHRRIMFFGERLGEPHAYSFGATRKNSDRWDIEFVISDNGRIRTIYLDDDGDGLADCALFLSYSPSMVTGATFDRNGDGL